MNDAAMEGIYLEKRMVKLFEKAGWDCKSCTPSDVFDIELCKDGKSFGYVVTYMCKNPRDMKRVVDRILDRIMELLNSVKPEIFILTDGKSFETYFRGEYFSTTTIPLEYNVYMQMNRLLAYYVLIEGEQNGNK